MAVFWEDSDMRSRFRAFFDGLTLGEQRVLIGLIVVGTLAAGVRYYSANDGEGFELIGQVDPKTNEIARIGDGARGAQGGAGATGSRPLPAVHNDQPVELNAAT
jgi:hypothetical protein